MSEVQPLPLESVFQSPETLEAALVAKEQAQEVHSPADVAAAMFARRLPILQNIVRKLSMKQIKRVVMNVASYPLVGDKYKPQDQTEKDAIYHFNEMVTEKMIMQLSLEQEKVLKAMEEKAIDQQTQEQGEKVNE